MGRNSNQKASMGTRSVRKHQRAGRRTDVTALQPPVHVSVPERAGKLRYTAVAAISGNFSNVDLFNLPGVAATTAILGTPIAYAVRLKKIEVWSPVQTAGSTVSCEIQDISGSVAGTTFTGRPITKTDSSISFDRPAHVVLRPGRLTPLGAWWNGISMTTTANLFSLRCPLGSVVDIAYEFIMNLSDIGSTAATPVVLVGATPGDLYCKVLMTNLNPTGVQFL